MQIYDIELEPLTDHQSAKAEAKWVYRFTCKGHDADRLLIPPTGLYHVIIPENATGIYMSNAIQPYMLNPASILPLSAMHWPHGKTLNFSGIAFHPQRTSSVLTNQIAGQKFDLNSALIRLLSSSKKTDEKARALSNWLKEHSDDLRSHSMIETAIEIMKKKKGKIPVEEIAKKLNTSSRHLRRSFKKTTGITPKIYLDVLKLNHFLRAHEQTGTLQQATLKSGFYDLSHLHRKLNQYFSLKPKDFTEGQWVVIKELMDG